MTPQLLRGYRGIALIVLLFLLAGALRINDVSLYTPDSSRYLIWGNAVAHGRGFVDDTQPDPDRFVINAPLYAALIAPVETIFPLSITAVKCWTLGWGALSVVLFFLFLQRHCTRRSALIGSALFAFNPAMVLFSTEMLSEAPFIAFTCGILLLSERSVPSCGRETRLSALLLVVLLACIGLLREVGVALVLAAALYFYSIGKFRRSLVILLSAGAVLGVWYYRNQVWVGSLQGAQKGNLSIVTEHFLTPSTAPLWQEMAGRIWASLNVYASRIGEMTFLTGFSRQLSDVIAEPSAPFRFLQEAIARLNVPIAVLIGLTGIAGIAADIRRSPTSWLRLTYLLLFLAIILAYPVHDIRFLLPITPLAIWYAGTGTGFLLKKTVPAAVTVRNLILLTAAGAVLLPNGLALAELDGTNIAYRRSPEELLRSTRFISALYTYDWKSVGRWVGEHTASGDVLASPMKELAVVSGGRKVVDLDPGVQLAAFEDALRDYHVQYLLAVVQGDLNVFEFQMTQTRRFWFEPVCDAGNLHLLRVRERNLTPPGSAGQFSPADTVTSIRLMRHGRSELLAGNYIQAESTLTRAYRRFPRHPAIVYETLVAALMAGDTLTAKGMYANLMALPQTMSYAGMARTQFDIAALLRTSVSSKMMEERAVTRSRAAAQYWKLGYYRRAAEVIDTLATGGSDYFMGLLWGIHYNLQNGDTLRAMRFLQEALRVDSSNIVVKVFDAILRTGDSLQTATSAPARSMLHLSLARFYRQIDLKDEAIDEAERALASDPSNAEAVSIIGRLFEKRGRPGTAAAVYRSYAGNHPGNDSLMARADSLDHKPR